MLLAHVLAIAALAAVPRWHDGLHGGHGAEGGDRLHECSVTLFLHGGVETPAAPVAAPGAPLWTGEQFFIRCSASVWIASVFALSRVFEHGPPLLPLRG